MPEMSEIGTMKTYLQCLRLLLAKLDC